MKMKKPLILMLTALLLLLITCPLLAAETDSYIVAVKDQANISPLTEKIYDLNQLTAVDHGLYETDKENAEKLKNCSFVEAVYESGQRTMMMTANDPYFSQQWALDAVHATDAWNITTGSSSINVVVIDSGLYTEHPDKGSITPGKDYVSGETVTYDRETHGTACAGIIGAATNNNIGITGACWNVNVTVLNAFYINNKGEVVGDDIDVISAIYDAVDVYHADVISMSFGGTSTVNELKDAVKYAYDRNTILIAASGNSGPKDSNYQYPAAYDQVVSVAAAENNIDIASFSTTNDQVFITAPGYHIWTLCNEESTNSNYAGKKYTSLNGTSFATPYVAALAALAKSIDRGITPDEFMYYLRTTSQDMESPGYDVASGYGMVNYAALLEKVKADQTNNLSGSGSEADPFLLANEEDLNRFAAFAASGHSGASARLTADIAISGSFSGISVPYYGVFDGAGHQISGLNANLFDNIGAGGTVKNLTVTADIANDRYAGIISSRNYGTITDCIAEGSIVSENAGGITGLNAGTVSRCVNHGAVNGEEYTGGIAAIEQGGTISYSYNTADIGDAEGLAGGICGYADNASVISSCYSIGSVAGESSTRGICGKRDSAQITNCYFENSKTSSGLSDMGIYGKTAADMGQKGFVCLLNNSANYFDLDSSNSNEGFPVLRTSSLTSHFNDISGGEWFAVAVYNLGADHIVSGRSDGLFYPLDNISRAEFITLLAMTSGEDMKSYDHTSSFSDVPGNAWYLKQVNWAAENGLAYGKTANTFCPNDKISREELSSFIVRYLNKYGSSALPVPVTPTFNDTAAISDWAQNDVALLSTLKIINGYDDHSFRPQNSATRAESSMMINKMREVL